MGEPSETSEKVAYLSSRVEGGNLNILKRLDPSTGSG